MSSDNSRRRLHLWSALILLGVFLCGAVAGAGAFAYLRPQRMRMHPPPGWHLDRLRELDLTPEQQRKAEAILENRHREDEAVIRETFPRVRAAEEQMEREMRAILTDAQAKKFDEISARHRLHPPHPGMHPFPPPDLPSHKAR